MVVRLAGGAGGRKGDHKVTEGVVGHSQKCTLERRCVMLMCFRARLAKPPEGKGENNLIPRSDFIFKKVINGHGRARLDAPSYLS